MIQDKAHPTPSDYCRMDDGRCGICGGDWSVCGCQGMLDRRSLAAPVASTPSAAHAEPMKWTACCEPDLSSENFTKYRELPSDGEFVYHRNPDNIGQWLRMPVPTLAALDANRAPVASNTTAEPAPIQPAGVEVEEAEPDLTIAYMCGFSDGKKARLGAAGVEVERDAARYRWLRDQADPDEGHPHVTVHEQNDWGKWNNTWTTGETLDVAIDQALAAASQGDRGKT